MTFRYRAKAAQERPGAFGEGLALQGPPDVRVAGHPVGWGAEDLAYRLANGGFEAPDTEAFPCLGLAYRAAAGGDAPATLNAANEVAVEGITLCHEGFEIK